MKQIYILLIALLMGLSANAEKSGSCGPNLKWHLTDDGVLTITGKGRMYYYSDSNSAPWSYSGVKRIIIGDSVTTIGEYAFYDCDHLTSVTIPNSVTTINNGAFRDCSSLTSVTIPNSVTTIGWSAFSGCSSLTSVTIPNSVTTIGWSAFSGCSSLTSVTIGNSVMTIDDYAFRDCSSLTSVTIPNSVTTIGDGAFGGCSSLTSVIIGNSVTTIGDNAFDNKNKTKIIWLTNTPPAGYRNVISGIHYVANDLYTNLDNKRVYPYLSSIFEVDGIKYVPVSPSERTCDAIDCTYTGDELKINKKVNYKGIDMTVREINPYTAYKCAKIKKAYIDIDGSIGNDAFSGCTNLTSVDIKKANDIGNNAFSGCTNLVSVDIKAGNNIGESAFRDCSSLITLSLYNKIKSLGRSAFTNCRNLKQFIIPDSVTILNYDLLKDCASLKSIRIHKGIKEMYHAFSGCTNLSTFIIEDRNTSLIVGPDYNNVSLYSCKLDSVYIGGKIVYNTSSDYRYSPFYRNTSLRTVKISDAETTIYDNEFYGCTNLQNVSIGDNVKSIGKWAFSGCSSLKNFTFGSGLQSIGQEAFSDCFNITQISSEAVVPPTCDINALDDINKWNCKLFVPKTNIDAYKQAAQWKEFFFIEGTTGITNTVYNKAELADVYTIDGAKRLSKASTDEINALPKGVYIVNGKKIIIKNQ
ncbi:leucine-rich repeat domain-containing protein [Prevotella jejuni]